MNEREPKRENGRTSAARRAPGLLLLGICALAAAAALWAAGSAGLFPVKYLLLGGAVLAGTVLAVWALVRDSARRGRFAVGAVLAVLFTGAAVVFAGDLNATVRTLQRVTNAEAEAAIAVFVPAESGATALESLSGATFGVLRTPVRGDTERAAQVLAEDLGGAAPALREYGGVSALVDALLDTGEVDAILLDAADLALLGDADGDAARRMRRIDLPPGGDPAPAEETPAPAEQGEPHVLTVYISGSDSRLGLDDTARSDVNILATVHTGTRQILLVTTPRDYFVPLSVSGGVPDKLTHAGIYGVDVSVETLEMLYGVEIDAYVRVNFAGFVGIVDALGGIRVYSDCDFSAGNMSFHEGYNELDGQAALTFARERYAFVLGDVQRGINEMRVLSAMIDKALSPEILTRYAALLKSLEGCFETSLSYAQIAALVRDQLENGGGWEVVQYSVGGFGDEQIPFSMGEPVYVMQPDWDTVARAKALMEKVRSGERILAGDLIDETE